MGAVARWCCSVLVAPGLLVAASGAMLEAAFGVQQSPSKPIAARDGDIIVVEGDARVRIVHRREAAVVTVYDPVERRLLVMVDLGFQGGKPDGGVDVNYGFHEVASWPLGERWAGPAVVEEYSFAGEFVGLALGIRTDIGLIQLLGGGRTDLFRDPAATVIAVKGTGRMGQTNPESFELTERRLVEQARRSAEMRKNLSLSPGARQAVADARTLAPAGSGPVRVGSGIRTPVKLVHVDAITPAGAQAAGVRGMVVLEVMIAADGSVTDAKVLRSIPLLDAAAVAAVKQWKYSPTLLNGGPVPIIITVTVNFQ